MDLIKKIKDFFVELPDASLRKKQIVLFSVVAVVLIILAPIAIYQTRRNLRDYQVEDFLFGRVSLPERSEISLQGNQLDFSEIERLQKKFEENPEEFQILMKKIEEEPDKAEKYLEEFEESIKKTDLNEVEVLQEKFEEDSGGVEKSE